MIEFPHNELSALKIIQRDYDPEKDTVMFYEEDNFGGRAESFNYGDHDFDLIDDHDYMASFRVPDGFTVWMYEHDFSGTTGKEVKIIGPYEDSKFEEMYKQVSAIRVRPTRLGETNEVVLYEYPQFTGKSHAFGVGLMKCELF